jgi:hypothetical protein
MSARIRISMPGTQANPKSIIPNSQRQSSSLRNSQSRPKSTASYLSSSVRLQPTKLAWASLSEKVHEFSRICFIDQTYPELLVSFGDVMRLHEDFLRRSAIVFNNMRPSTAPGPSARSESRAPVSVEKSAKNLVDDWRHFAESLIAVSVQGIDPLYSFITGRLSFLAQMLQTLSEVYGLPQPTMAMRAMRKVQITIDQLKYDAARLSEAARGHSNNEFDLSEYQRLVASLANRIEDLCHNVIPKNSSVLKDMVATKRELLLAAENAVHASIGVGLFDDGLEDLASAVVIANEELQKLFQVLGIPESMVPLQPQDSDDEGEMDSGRPTSLGVVKNLARMHQLLTGMDDELSDPSQLFPPKL